MIPVLASGLAALILTGGVPRAASTSGSQETEPPRFKAGVARVSIGVTVRGSDGRLVAGLGRDDFTVIDSGTVKPLTDFQVGAGGVSLAAVIDGSGSMSLGGRIELAHQAFEALVHVLGAEDEVALFSFDSVLRELHPFTRDTAALQASLARLRPFGSTSIHDAIAQAARVVTKRSNVRRAVMMMTDGLDTSSELSPADASAIASSVDVPVYLLGIEPSARRVRRVERCAGPGGGKAAELACLALWTGGAFSIVRGADEAQGAVNQAIEELRHQYLLAFEASTEPGWHAIEVKVRGARLVARTRTWYWVSKPNA